MHDESVSATLSRLRSECETCGAWSAFTGKTELDDGQTYAIVRCPNRDGEFTVWNRDREPLLAAYVRARAALTDADAYDRAFATLTGRDGAAIAALAASPPAELPMFAIEDIALPATAAKRWVELVLDWNGWRPTPNRSVRVEEALATAVKLQSAEAVELIAAQVKPLEVPAVIDRIKRRFRDHDLSLLGSVVPSS